MDRVTFHVPNISCGHCVATIQRVVKEEVKGIGDVVGDIDGKRVTIDYEAPATVEAIVACMTEWDYAPAEQG